MPDRFNSNEEPESAFVECRECGAETSIECPAGRGLGMASCYSCGADVEHDFGPEDGDDA